MSNMTRRECWDVRCDGGAWRRRDAAGQASGGVRPEALGLEVYTVRTQLGESTNARRHKPWRRQVETLRPI